MRMTLTEARAECRRYLDYLAMQEKRAEALQKLAADRRAGRCDAHEGERRKRDIMGPSPTVYDGGNLADAIVVMMKVTQPPILARTGGPRDE